MDHFIERRFVRGGTPRPILWRVIRVSGAAVWVPTSPGIFSLHSSGIFQLDVCEAYAGLPKDHWSFDSDIRRIGQEMSKVDHIRGVGHTVGRDDPGDPSSAVVSASELKNVRCEQFNPI